MSTVFEDSHDINSHKVTGNGEVISDAQWSKWLDANGLQFEGNVRTEGGLISRVADNIPTGWVLPPVFRDAPGALREDEIKTVITDDRLEGENTPLSEVKQGVELEMFGYDGRTRDMAPIMSDKARAAFPDLVPVHNKDLFGDNDKRWGCSSELLESCLEVGFKEDNNRERSAVRIVQQLQLVQRMVEVTTPGAQILPVSTLPHRELTKADLTSDDYVRTMALKVMGWEKAQYFTGASAQGHTEGLSQSAILYAANQLQHISALLYALTLAAPFTHGEPTGLSGRYEICKKGSPSAGVYVEPLPLDPQAYYWDIIQPQLKAGETPSADRGAGQHRTRSRFSIKPHGTIESVEGDTAGADPNRLIAMQYLRDVVLWKFQHFYLHGDYSFYDRYPRLFGEPSKQTYERADENSKRIAAQGLEAPLFGHDGVEYSGKELFRELLAFAKEPVVKNGQVLCEGLPPLVSQHLHKGTITPTQASFGFYLRQGFPSAEGYYQSGIGTVAHWQRERYNRLRGDGFSHDDALHNTLADISDSWDRHIRTFKPEAAAKLVSFGTKP